MGGLRFMWQVAKLRYFKRGAEITESFTVAKLIQGVFDYKSCAVDGIIKNASYNYEGRLMWWSVYECG